MIHAGVVVIDVGAGEGSFSSGLAQYAVFFRTQAFLQLVVPYFLAFHAISLSPLPLIRGRGTIMDMQKVTGFMGTTPLSIVLLVLSFLGLADAWYLTASAINHTALSCDLGAVLDGCNIVAKSDYSFFMGVPLALYGVLFYAAVFVLSAAVLVLPARLFYQALVVLGAVGSLASLVFLYIQFFLIKAICIYCIASAVITFMVFLVAYDLWKKHRAAFRLALAETT